MRKGDSHGWINKSSVLHAALVDWYKRLLDNQSVENSGRKRAKFEGVLFDIVHSGDGPAISGGSGVVVHGHAWPVGTFAGYENVNTFLQRRPGAQMLLSLKFPGNYPMRANDPSLIHAYGRPYATVEQGDYVYIDAQTRRVLVNGERRRLQ